MTLEFIAFLTLCVSLGLCGVVVVLRRPNE